MTALPPEPLMSVVIPVRNEGSLVRSTIASIVEGRSYPFPLQIVVVDDASSDGACSSLSTLHHSSGVDANVEITVVRLPQWSGVPYARNAGARAAKADTLFMTDANVWFPQRWDRPIWAAMAPGRVLCATIGDTKSSFRGYGGTLHIPSMSFVWVKAPASFGGYVPLSPCSGTILSSELFRRAGGYDTAMPVYGAAEPELSIRLWLCGAEIVSLPDLVIQHRFKPPAERRPFIEAISLLQLQNYLRFGLLYLDRPRTLQMFHHYNTKHPQRFEGALRRVLAGDVWDRRDLLRRTLPHEFSAFVRRFGLRDAAGQLAA